MDVSDYYNEMIGDSEVWEHFRYLGSSMLPFFEWYSKYGALKKRKRLRTILLLMRSIARRLIYWQDNKPVMHVGAATNLEEYYDGIFKNGAMFEPVARYLPSSAVIDVFMDGNLFKAKKEHICMDSYLTFNNLKRAMAAYYKFRKRWKSLRHIFPSALREQGDVYFKDYALIDIIEINCYGKLFWEKDVQSFTSFDAFGPYGMRGYVAAKMLGIKTIGVQCGMWASHTKERSKTEQSAKLTPFPDIYLAWGTLSRRQLTNDAKYPKERIKIIGSTRYDVLSHKQPRRCSRLKILLTTQQDGIPYMPYTVRDALVMLWRNDINVIIKRHRGEGGMYRDLKIYDNFRIVDHNLNKHLAECDILISARSSSILEAAILGKPYIIFDPEIFDTNYAHKMFYAHDLKSLAEILRKMIYSKRFRNNVIARQRKILDKHCYKIDGNASKRAAREIENITN